MSVNTNPQRTDHTGYRSLTSTTWRVKIQLSTIITHVQECTVANVGLRFTNTDAVEHCQAIKHKGRVTQTAAHMLKLPSHNKAVTQPLSWLRISVFKKKRIQIKCFSYQVRQHKKVQIVPHIGLVKRNERPLWDLTWVIGRFNVCCTICNYTCKRWHWIKNNFHSPRGAGKEKEK